MANCQSLSLSGFVVAPAYAFQMRIPFQSGEFGVRMQSNSGMLLDSPQPPELVRHYITLDADAAK